MKSRMLSRCTFTCAVKDTFLNIFFHSDLFDGKGEENITNVDGVHYLDGRSFGF